MINNLYDEDSSNVKKCLPFKSVDKRSTNIKIRIERNHDNKEEGIWTAS